MKVLVLYAFKMAENKYKFFDYVQGMLRTWWKPCYRYYNRVLSIEKRANGIYS